jgi:anti-anti-sigma regulatory factor
MNPFQPMYPPLTRTPRLLPGGIGLGGPVGESLLLKGGWYDAARHEDLKLELHGFEPHGDGVLDLVRTKHLDCASLGILIAKLLTWRKRKPEINLRLLNVAPKLANILRLLQLDQVFLIESERIESTD